MTTRALTTDAPTRSINVPGAKTTGPPTGPGVSRLVIALAVTGTILLALGAFWLSFTTLRDLAVLSGISGEQAWIWPLIVDGVILEATISVVALRNSATAARRFAWLLLAAGAGVSVAANITHAVVAADTRVPALIAALVASVPPLVLLAMTHLTVELTRNTNPVVAATGSRQHAVIEEARPAGHQRVTPTVRPVPSGVESASAPRVKRPTPHGTASASRVDARVRALSLNADGISKRQIATELGVHPTTVGRWLNAPDRRQDGDSHD